MSDKRKPYFTVSFRNDKGRKKIEVYRGEEFPIHLYCDVRGDLLETASGRFRIRINGVWMPKNNKVMYTADELWAMLARFTPIWKSENEKDLERV